ncbi:MAG: transcriptional repressor LexA [Candidatus Merdivicinus sp.]|jgi:repressor LexA
MLSKKGQLIYDYIRDCILNHNFSPTVREICEEVGIRSTSTVHYYLKELADEGYIIKDDLKKRTIKLPSGTSCAVPLLGTVTAGLPISAIEEIEEYIPVANLNGNSEDYFALHVRGDSMIRAGILDGDIIVVRKTPVCRNGDIVVALIDDEATVKRFYREKGYFRLMPENPAYEPIIVEESEGLTILGRVAALIRNY